MANDVLLTWFSDSSVGKDIEPGGGYQGFRSGKSPDLFCAPGCREETSCFLSNADLA
jgi:hypothetical protein